MGRGPARDRLVTTSSFVEARGAAALEEPDHLPSPTGVAHPVGTVVRSRDRRPFLPARPEGMQMRAGLRRRDGACRRRAVRVWVRDASMRGDPSEMRCHMRSARPLVVLLTLFMGVWGHQAGLATAQDIELVLKGGQIGRAHV